MSSRRSSPRKNSRLVRRLILSFRALLQALKRFTAKAFRSAVSRIQPNQNRQRSQKAGFVLPTTILVLLVIGLFTGAIISRSGNRAEDVIRTREIDRIDSVAAPAVERAKAKLEFLFNRDERLPVTVPTETILEELMLYVSTANVNLIEDGSGGFLPDPYTLPGETRLDANGDTTVDNAWTYQTDLDGDGVDETVAYSIILRNEKDINNDGDVDDDVDVTLADDEETKANNLVARTGPLSIKPSSGISADCEIPALADEEGWYGVSATSVRKNFQVDIFVENQNEANKTVAAVEFLQDRQIDRGNKYGVWFRYDLLIHPGPQFNLNGAIHTDGNLITWNNSLQFYLVSSDQSCLALEQGSIIEIAQQEDPITGQLTFQGQAISTGGDTEEVDVFTGGGTPTTLPFEQGNDSIVGTPNVATGIYENSLDPLRLYTEDKLISRSNQLPSPNEEFYDTSVRDTNWEGSGLSKRIRNENQQKPYIDDFYRADDRWGPKPSYGKEAEVLLENLENSSGTKIGFEKYGTLITENPPANLGSFGTSINELLEINPAPESPEDVGLDGYWERRAYTQGLRIIVGQRLELGNPFGWLQDNNGDGDYTDPGDQDYGDDPLQPVENLAGNQGTGNARVNEERQLKTLRDNLAAVQATLVYHHNDDNDDGSGEFPIATLATTAHPGTATTVADSTTFNTVNIPPGGVDLNNDGTITDPEPFINTEFLTGVGTNGWEFQPPGSRPQVLGFSPLEINDDAAFGSLLNNSSFVPTLETALNNLAHLAGDPFGAFPPFQDLGDGTADSNDAVPAIGEVVHPYPQLTMWGDFSNLRRVLDRDINRPGGTPYSDLSVADKSTLHSAAATLGMLSHNLFLRRERFFDSPTGGNSGVDVLGQTIVNLIDGDISNGEMGGDPTDLCESPKNYGDSGCPTVDPYGEDINENGVLDSGEDTNNNGVLDEPLPSDPEHFSNYYTDFTSEEWLAVIDAGDYVNAVAGTAAADTDAAIANAQRIIDEVQVRRDRALGFALNNDRGIPDTGANTGGYDSSSATFTLGEDLNDDGNIDTGEDVNGNGILDVQISQGRLTNALTFNNIICKPSIFQGFISDDAARFGLSVAFCPSNQYTPKYPALYYLFPIAEHDHQGNLSSALPPGSSDLEVIQPRNEDTNGNGALDAGEDLNGNGTLDTADEPYVSDPYINNVNGSYIYQVVGDITPNGIEDTADVQDGGNGIRLSPRDRSNWVTPETTTAPTVTALTSGLGLTPPTAPGNLSGSSGLPNPAALTPAAINQINDNGTNVFIPFLDKGMYNGRQQMAVRVMNIDLGLLRDNTIPGGSDESWLPNSGVIYGFREDAVREDGIARPNVDPWSSCNTETELANTSNNCYMDPAVPRDPPKLDKNAISPKPVDYIADPDRRPHGFRLSNGSKLGRLNTSKGISFVTDQPTYFLGDFNLHSREEFTQLLEDNYNNFYTRSNLDVGFAKADVDNPGDANNDDWRPAEVLADSLTFLSNQHCDGVIEDAIRGANSCSTGPNVLPMSSYRNTKLDPNDGGPDGNDTGNFWNRENPDNPNSPIKVNRNGKILFNNGTNDGVEYDELLGTNNVQALNDPSETSVNSVVVQGLSPTRENESYGGLHNFPRFNEDWNRNRDPGTGSNIDLNIDGSLIQLNFSLYDTANLDQQDTFRPRNNAQGGNNFPFYTPPNRKWGYDVGLQYNSPAPIVERLLSRSGLRSEVYEEIDIRDPYIQQLCQAVNPNSSTCQ